MRCTSYYYSLAAICTVRECEQRRLVHMRLVPKSTAMAHIVNVFKLHCIPAVVLTMSDSDVMFC